MERIRLDIIPKGLMPVCHASQYDDGRVIRLDLMDGLQGYSLTDEEIELDVRKPDGHIVTASVDVVAGNTYVDIVTTEQMCAVEGENICELKISKDGAEIYSLNFKMKVEKSVLEGGDPSESFIHNLNQQIYDAVADQYEGNVIFDDVPTADHGTPYTVTSEGIKQAIEDATPDNLFDLNDVSISSPTTNQALVWDADNNKWTNGEVSTVGSIDDLNDVDTTGKADGDSLRYDNANHEWVAKPTTIEMTQAEWNAIADKAAWRNAHKNTHLVIKDAPNLNPTASDIEYSSGVTVKQAIDSKADITALPSVKYQEINVALDNSGEGTLFTENKLVVGIKDIPSDSLYVGYAVYFAGTLTKIKSFSRSGLPFTSQNIASMTRKVGVWYLDNITIS